MNVLLISLQNSLPIIGLNYLHYQLLRNNYNSFLLYLPRFHPRNDKALDNIRKFVSGISPKFIGISLMSREYFNVCKLTGYLKDKFPSIPVIWGGIHPTIVPETCLNYADYVCIGEGWQTILDLADAVNKNKSPGEIKNLSYFRDGRIIKNPLYPLLENLDEMPLCERIPLNSFVQEGGWITQFTKQLFKKHDRFIGATYSIISSLGCPFYCTFCCNNFVSNLYRSRLIRRRSVPNIISELEKAVKDEPGIEYINFHDDCFLASNTAYLEGFCESYKKRVRRPFITRSIPIYISEEKIEMLKDAGLAWINIGLQSGSDRVLQDVYKRHSLKRDFLRAGRLIKKFKIAAFYDVILDNPFENRMEKLETAQTLMETPKPFYMEFFSLNFFPGTELYERAKKECPQKIEDCLDKDYLRYRKDVINDIIRLSAFLGENYMNKIIHLYKQNQAGYWFKINLFLAKIISAILFEPLAYFRVIKLSQGGSYLKTIKVIPAYLKIGSPLYFYQFMPSSKKITKRNLASA